MTVQELGDKLQNIAHEGSSLSRCYFLCGNKLKEIINVEVIPNGNGKYIIIGVEE
jgi:hypothetical protein